MHRTIETVNYKSHVINIFRDDRPENPREWDSNTGIIIHHPDFLRHYEVIEEDHIDGDVISLDFTLHGYVHKICVPKSDVRRNYGCRRISRKVKDRILCVLSLEAEVYVAWVNGDVFGYQTYKYGVDEVVDDCWGYYGADFEKNWLLPTAREWIDSLKIDNLAIHRPEMHI